MYWIGAGAGLHARARLRASAGRVAMVLNSQSTQTQTTQVPLLGSEIDIDIIDIFGFIVNEYNVITIA
eukprot:COSAG02_NODE_1160_length_14177_cov_208.515130_4_plen_68_part_00